MNNFRIGFFLTIATLLYFQVSSQVLINEFSAANYDLFADNYGEFEDWIELYNTTGTAVDISGWHLSDRATNPMKFVIPNGVTVPANGHLRVWASKRGEFQGGGVLHTNFKIIQTKGNEGVYFSDQSGVIVDSHSVSIPNQLGHSTGRTSDGATTWGIFTSPSPGNTNIT